MVDYSEEVIRQFISSFLEKLRATIREQGLQATRLPGWISKARVRSGWINQSLISVFEDSLDADTFDIRGPVRADTVILLDVENFIPSTYISRELAPNAKGHITIAGYPGENAIVVFTGERPAFTYYGYTGYHYPRTLFNLFFQHKPGGPDTDPVISRFVPLAVYLHHNEATNPVRLWDNFGIHLMKHLLVVHNSDYGDFYEQLREMYSALATMKNRHVIVLGKYSGTEFRELVNIRDHLRSMGYEALFIKELPEIPMMSNEEKVRFWTQASRFCVMIDRAPAGHIAEYTMLKSQRSIVALLRPNGSGSTYMIGDDSLVDINFIKLFEFSETPLSVIKEAVSWAEQVVSLRAKTYNKSYPWRK